MRRNAPVRDARPGRFAWFLASRAGSKERGPRGSESERGSGGGDDGIWKNASERSDDTLRKA